MYQFEYNFFKKMLVVLALLNLILLSGCATIHVGNAPDSASLYSSNEVDVRLYQIYIGSQGELIDPYTRKRVEKEKDYLDAIFKNIELVNTNRQASGRGLAKLTIFIHGGLNSFENATDRVNRVQAQMLGDGNYPLFISWDSGFPGNYRDHLFVVRRGIHRPVAGTLTSPIVFVEDLARSVIHIPVALYNVLFGQRSLHRLYETAEERAANRSQTTLKSAKEFHLLQSKNNFGHSTVEDTLWLNP